MVDSIWLKHPSEVIYLATADPLPSTIDPSRVLKRDSLDCPLPYPRRVCSADNVSGSFIDPFESDRHGAVTFDRGGFFGHKKELYHIEALLHNYNGIIHFRGCQGMDAIERVHTSLGLPSSACRVHMAVFSSSLGKRVDTALCCYLENRVSERFKGLRVVNRVVDDTVVVRLQVADFTSPELPTTLAQAGRPTSLDVTVTYKGSVLYRFSWRKQLWTGAFEATMEDVVSALTLRLQRLEDVARVVREVGGSMTDVTITSARLSGFGVIVRGFLADCGRAKTLVWSNPRVATADGSPLHVSTVDLTQILVEREYSDGMKCPLVVCKAVVDGHVMTVKFRKVLPMNPYTGEAGTTEMTETEARRFLLVDKDPVAHELFGDLKCLLSLKTHAGAVLWEGMGSTYFDSISNYFGRVGGFLGAMALVLKRLHARRFAHLDSHGGNFMLKTSMQGDFVGIPRIFLIDTDRLIQIPAVDDAASLACQLQDYLLLLYHNNKYLPFFVQMDTMDDPSPDAWVYGADGRQRRKKLDASIFLLRLCRLRFNSKAEMEWRYPPFGYADVALETLNGAGYAGVRRLMESTPRIKAYGVYLVKQGRAAMDDYMQGLMGDVNRLHHLDYYLHREYCNMYGQPEPDPKAYGRFAQTYPKLVPDDTLSRYLQGIADAPPGARPLHPVAKKDLPNNISDVVTTHHRRPSHVPDAPVDRHSERLVRSHGRRPADYGYLVKPPALAPARPAPREVHTARVHPVSVVPAAAPDKKPSTSMPYKKPSTHTPDKTPSASAPDKKPSASAPGKMPPTPTPDMKPSTPAPATNLKPYGNYKRFDPDRFKVRSVSVKCAW